MLLPFQTHGKTFDLIGIYHFCTNRHSMCSVERGWQWRMVQIRELHRSSVGIVEGLRTSRRSCSSCSENDAFDSPLGLAPLDAYLSSLGIGICPQNKVQSRKDVHRLKHTPRVVPRIILKHMDINQTLFRKESKTLYPCIHTFVRSVNRFGPIFISIAIWRSNGWQTISVPKHRCSSPRKHCPNCRGISSASLSEEFTGYAKFINRIA